MKMISSVQNPQQKIPFSDINVGECFATRNGIWIKSDHTSGGFCLCVNLNDGIYQSFTSNDYVMKLYCELHHQPVNFSEL